MQKKHLRKFNILLDKNTQQTGNRWELSQNNKGHVNDISIMAAQDIPPLIIKDIYKNPIANSILLFLAALRGMRNQGLNPCPLQWKYGVLTTGPPRKFH